MKKVFSVISTLVIVCLTACDKIEGPVKEQIVVNDFCTTGIEDSVTHKKVLVEDYTGHTCGNCPGAALFLNDTLKSTYNHCLVVISIHAGFFSGTCPTAISCPPGAPSGSFTTNFTTAAGNNWNTFFGISGNPKGMVNRIDYPGSHSKSFAAWAPAVAAELEREAQVKLKITNTYNQTNRNLSVSVQTDFLFDLTGDYKLQVVVIEDSLVDWQVWYSHSPELVPDYVHRHVLRDVINSTWGESVATGNAPAGTSVTKNYSYTIPSNFNDEHCAIIAFVYNDDTKEVFQTEELEVR